MNRRRFIKVTLISSVSATPILAGCGAATPAVAPVASELSAVTSVAGKKVADYFIDFLFSFGVELLANQAADGIKNLTGSQNDNAESCKREMILMNFTSPATGLYNFNNNIIFFGMEKPGTPDLCVGFINKKGYFMEEGPGILGIALSGMNWDRSDIYPPSALLPIKSYQEDILMFNSSLKTPYIFDTSLGTMEMIYDSRPAQKEGMIRVKSIVDNLAVHDKTFGISWT